jgi:type II secretory pathway pseudopilin PulG
VTIIGILATVLTPYILKTADNKARELGVINAVRAIQTALEMYAEKQTSAPFYPTDLDILTATVNSLASLVSPAIVNPFNNKRYLAAVYKKDDSTFYLGVEPGTETIVPGVILYEVSPEGKSYILTPLNSTCGDIPLPGPSYLKAFFSISASPQ